MLECLTTSCGKIRQRYRATTHIRIAIGKIGQGSVGGDNEPKPKNRGANRKDDPRQPL
jgi:hypothetical protein